MMSDALRRSGLRLVAALALTLIGCEESPERQAARDAQDTQEQAARAVANVSLDLNSATLAPAVRDQRVTEALNKGRQTLESLIARQPNYWPAKSQLGSLLAQQADFNAMRASESIGAIRQHFAFAAQAVGTLRFTERAAAHEQSVRHIYVDALAGLGTQKAELQKQLADLRQKIADCDKNAGELRAAAKGKNDKGQADKTAADSARAEAEQMKLSEAQLAKLADAALRQVAAQDLISQAADIEAEADTLVNLKERESLAGLDATATSNPDAPGAPTQYVAALGKVSDEKSRAELSAIAVQARLRAIDVAEADAKKAIAAAEAALSGGQDNLNKTLQVQRDRTKQDLARLAAASKDLQAAAAAADAAYAAAVNMLVVAHRAAEAEARERQAAEVSTTPVQPPDALLELSIQMQLCNTLVNYARLHQTLADIAPLLDDAAQMVTDQKLTDVSVVATAGADADRKVAEEQLAYAAGVMKAAEGNARKCDETATNRDIRDAKLWSKAIKDRSALIEQINGGPVAAKVLDPSRATVPMPPTGGPGLAGPAASPAPSAGPAAPADPVASPVPSPVASPAGEPAPATP